MPSEDARPGLSTSDAGSRELSFVNLFLRGEQADALPFEVGFPWGDPFDLDSELTARGDQYTPIRTAVIRLDPNTSSGDMVARAAWLSSLLSFITRSPTYANALVDRGGLVGAREEALLTNITPPRFGRRRGPHAFRRPADLRGFIERGIARMDRPDFDDSGVAEAMEWHNFARSGHEIHYLDIQLAHQWIALEILAARWGRKHKRDKLLTKRQADEARDCLKDVARRLGLGEAETKALTEKSAELRRRPMKGLVLEYLRSAFAPYDAQPTDARLEALLSNTIRWRNTTLHEGSLAMHEWKRDASSKTGAQQVRDGVMELEGITARALLGELDAPLDLLTQVPWTDWRQPA